VLRNQVKQTDSEGPPFDNDLVIDVELGNLPILILRLEFQDFEVYKQAAVAVFGETGHDFFALYPDKLTNPRNLLEVTEDF